MLVDVAERRQIGAPTPAREERDAAVRRRVRLGLAIGGVDEPLVEAIARRVCRQPRQGRIEVRGYRVLGVRASWGDALRRRGTARRDARVARKRPDDAKLG